MDNWKQVDVVWSQTSKIQDAMKEAFRIDMPEREHAEHRLRVYDKFTQSDDDVEVEVEYHAYYRSLCFFPGFEELDAYQRLCQLPYVPEEEWLVYSLDNHDKDHPLSEVVFTGFVNWGPEGDPGPSDPLINAVSEILIARLGLAMVDALAYSWDSLSDLEQRILEWKKDNNVEVTTRIREKSHYKPLQEWNQNRSEQVVGA
jgi:hypothetical protein